jgi:hypothetical protein
VIVIAKIDDVAWPGWRLGSIFIHKADRPLDDVAELAGPLIHAPQDDGSPLQVVARKHECSIHP